MGSITLGFLISYKLKKKNHINLSTNTAPQAQKLTHNLIIHGFNVQAFYLKVSKELLKHISMFQSVR